MKCRNASAIAMGAALTCTAHLAVSSEIVIHVPDTAAARSAAGLISRAERAIRRYMGACESPVAADPRDVVTSDARIEYTLDDPGAYLSFDASPVLAECAMSVASIPLPTNLWIYPTGEHNAVFIQYDMPNPGAGPLRVQQIAFVELRGERISRMRNFGAAPAPLLTAMGAKAQSERCANLSRYDGSLAGNNLAANADSRPRDPGASIAFSP